MASLSTKNIKHRCNGMATAHLIVISEVDVPGHAKVANLDNLVVTHQTVSGRQIPMHKVLLTDKGKYVNSTSICKNIYIY